MSDYNQPPPATDDVLVKDYEGIREIQMQGYEDGVKKARNALFWTGGLSFFWEIVGLARSPEGLGDNPVAIGIAAAIAAIFVALGLWTKSKPYTAIIVGLSFFILYWLFVIGINGYLEGGKGILKGVFGGIIIKVVVLVIMGRSLSDAKELQALKAEKNF